MTARIITETLPGNVHESASYINKCGIASYTLSIDFNGGYNSVGVFRVNNYFEYLDYCKCTGKKPMTELEYHATLIRRAGGEVTIFKSTLG